MSKEGVVLGHFAVYRFADRFWQLDGAVRKERARTWLSGLEQAAGTVRVYMTQGLETSSDVLLWSSASIADPADVGAYFSARATAENAHRDVIVPEHFLWGLTRPSEYSRAQSAQEIDPFATERAPYLVAYPFTKTAEWYVLGRDTRQGMMNEHIRIGKQFTEIKQLLLYSFGLQDQEFVVVYEMADLSVFSRLVHELRGTEGRRFTKGDVPIHTGVLMSPERWSATLG
jgi:chlorite dismutase